MASDPHQMFPVGPLAHSYQHQYNAWSAPHAQQPISVRQYPSTSSAFSASAHPDEDWTKVSDLAERRRIQNRIAQRNYRKLFRLISGKPTFANQPIITGKKIKERMQFLESKAGGDDGKGGKKPSKPNSTKKQQQQQSQHQRRRSSPPVSSSASLAAPVALHHPYTPPMNPEDQPFFPSPSPPASSPPPFSAYQQSYSPPSDNGFYSHHPVTTWMGTGALTATTAAPTLPPMTHFSEAYNKGNESMSFATYGDYSLGVPATASPYDSNPHVSTHHHHHQQSAPRNSALLPPLSYHGGIGVSSSSTTSSTSPATGHLAAPDLHRSRYSPPPAPARV